MLYVTCYVYGLGSCIINWAFFFFFFLFGLVWVHEVGVLAVSSEFLIAYAMHTSSVDAKLN